MSKKIKFKGRQKKMNLVQYLKHCGNQNRWLLLKDKHKVIHILHIYVLYTHCIACSTRELSTEQEVTRPS